MNDKLDFLLNQANIGNYNKCETIEIIAFPKEGKGNPFNIFTLIIFENTQQEKNEEYLTDRLIKLSKDINWGIKRRIIDIEEAKKIYSDLILNNELNLDSKIKIDIGKLKFLSEQYIPAIESMDTQIQLNNILKNNFHNGSYILEFFDEEKQNIDFLLNYPVLLNDFSEAVNAILPIKIGTLSDRLGNVIFQFPLNSFKLLHSSMVDKTLSKPKFEGVRIEILPQNEDFDIKNLLIRFYEENSDKVIERHKVIEVTDTITEVDFDDSFGTYIEIIDLTTQLLLYRCRMFTLKKMEFSISLHEHQKRVFEVDGKKEKLDISTNASYSVIGRKQLKPFNEWISNRTYAEQLNELEKSKSFIQYFGNEEDKALSDIRELINQYGKRGVYIWDPYLSAIDIKKTLYYAKKTYMPMKAISGLKQDKSKEKAKKDMLSEFKKDKKEFLFLDLEVRGKIGANGYDFHDRFLIFPLEKPKVWSLGISINQLGKSHHIVQEVKHAQHILNAFDKLWDELNYEECLVWKNN